jgi:hypothetical protein
METQADYKQTTPPRYDHYRTDHLDTLAVLHLVKGILNFTFSLFFIFYAFMGGIFSRFPVQHHSEIPFDLSLIFYLIGGIGFLICIVLGTLNMISYSYLKKRKKHGFVFAISIVNCVMGVLGIILGIFTIIEINKPHVKDQFS